MLLAILITMFIAIAFFGSLGYIFIQTLREFK